MWLCSIINTPCPQAGDRIHALWFDVALLIHWISNVEKQRPGAKTKSPFIVLPHEKQNLMDPMFLPIATHIQFEEGGVEHGLICSILEFDS